MKKETNIENIFRKINLKEFSAYIYFKCFFASRDKQQLLRQERGDELDFLEKQLELLSCEVKEKIKVMVEDVERKVI